jgi:hypothetical protein
MNGKKKNTPASRLVLGWLRDIRRSKVLVKSTNQLDLLGRFWMLSVCYDEKVETMNTSF